MAELKTKPTEASVLAFLNAVDNDRRRRDSIHVMEMMRRITGWEPRMWGPSIIGFGAYRYKYDSGREGRYLVTGLSPRKQALSVYVMTGFSKFPDLMNSLGKYKTGKSCLYINKLEDVDPRSLEDLIRLSVDRMKDKYAAPSR